MQRAPLPVAAGFVFFSATAGLFAQTFDYPTFASTAGLALNGSSASVSGQLRLTNLAADNGSFWYGTQVPVAAGFETRFDFVISSLSEGLAFVIHDSPTGSTTLGGSLWGMGYGFGGNNAPITNCLAIEVDAILDTFLNDTSANELSVHTVGLWGNSENENVSIARVTPTSDLSNGSQHTLRVRYTPGVGVQGTLEIWLDAIVAPVITVPFSFENGGQQILGGTYGGLGITGGDAWVGFTSTNPGGASGQSATVRAWNWTSYQLPDSCYVGNVLAGSGGPYDVLLVNNGVGGFFRTANITVGNPFTVSVNTPPGVPSAPFVLLVTIGTASGATAVSTPYGMACFPLVSIVEVGSFFAPHTLTAQSGTLLTVPLTLQAVMAPSAANPSLIQLTNAVAMLFSFAPGPLITSVSPNSAAVGAPISVVGSNFSPLAAVDINGTPVTPTATSPTQIVFPMPAGLPCGSVLRVRNPDTTSATIAFNPTPAITNQINTSGPAAGGTSFIVIGTGFALGTTVTIGGASANVTSASATLVVAVTPPGQPGPRPVVITTPGGCIVNTTFTYL